MYTADQLLTLKSNVQKISDELLEIEPEKLVRNELGIELNFTAGMQSFNCINNLLKEFKTIDLDLLSFQQLSSISTQLTAIKTAYKNIREFSITKHPNNTSQERDAFLDDIASKSNTLFALLNQYITYYRKTSEHEKKAAYLVNEIRNGGAAALSQISVDAKEIQDTLSKVRSAAAEVGVAQHSIHFAKTADEHNKYANIWLWCTVALVLITLVFASIFAVNLYNIIQKGSSIDAKENVVSTVYLVQYGIAKLLLLSILYFAVLWSNKNYKAHRHCNVVNKHRQNALSTFEAFVKSTDDPQTKNAVLMQASNCIFTPQHTGYLTFEPESGTNPTILEIVRGVAEKK